MWQDLSHDYFSIKSQGPSFVTGHKIMFMLVFTWACLTSPLWSENTCKILPITQEFLGAESSTTSTTSSGLRFLLVVCHFCLSCKSGRYSLTQRLQNRSAIYWTWRHLRLEYKSALSKIPGGIEGLTLISKKWFGVRASKSFGSLETQVMGRLLRIAFTLHNRVCKLSSSRDCCFTTELRTFLIPYPAVNLFIIQTLHSLT